MSKAQKFLNLIASKVALEKTIDLTIRCCLGLLAFTCASYGAAEPLHLECAIKGQSFDSKFQEVIGIKIDQGMIDIISEEFSMFGKVEESTTTFKARKNFTSNKGVKYFFNIEIDRVSGRFIAYETAAYPNRKIYNTTGSGPCSKISAQKFATIKAGTHPSQSVKIIIKMP